jgi:hypothetical protein
LNVFVGISFTIYVGYFGLILPYERGKDLTNKLKKIFTDEVFTNKVLEPPNSRSKPDTGYTTQ